MSADAERALIVTFPPVLLYGGRPPAFLGNFSRRAKPSRTFLLAPGAQTPSSSQSPLYSGRPSMGIRHVAPLLLLSPPNPLRWALAGTPIKCLRCTNTAWPGITVAGGDSIQKGNEVSHKAFLPTFFSEKSRLPADDVFRNLPQRLSGLHIKALAAGQVGQRDDAHQLSSLHHRQAAHLLAGHELGGGPAIVLG